MLSLYVTLTTLAHVTGERVYGRLADRHDDRGDDVVTKAIITAALVILALALLAAITAAVNSRIAKIK